LDDLITSYTNAGAPELAPRGGSRPRHGLRTPRVTVPHLADVARLVYQLDGSRHAVSLRRGYLRLRRWSKRTTVDDDAIPLFIKHGADLTIRNKKGETVVEAAKAHGPVRQEALRKAIQEL